MKRILWITAMIITTGFLWSNGAAEKLDTLEGEVVSIDRTETEAIVHLLQADGTETEVVLPIGEADRLQIRAHQQLEVTTEEGTTTVKTQSQTRKKTQIQAKTEVKADSGTSESPTLPVATETKTQTKAQTGKPEDAGSGRRLGKS